MSPDPASSPAKLRQRIASRHSGVLTAVCVLFGGLLLLGIYHVQGTGSVPTGPRYGVGAGAGPDYLDANDPVARFTETRVGHVLFAPRTGDQCQRVLFDNSTGTQYESQPVDCGRPSSEPVGGNDRIGALRKSFQK